MILKEVRKEKGISQTQAAHFLNVPLRSYKRYENDQKYIESLKYKFLVHNLKKYRQEQKRKRNVKKLKIVVAGIGYVGLSTALVLSGKADVTLIDINIDKVNQINKKISPIENSEFYEAVKKSNLKASNDIFKYKDANVVIVATPTDYDELTKSLDIFSVESVIRTVREINKKCLIVIRSTVPTGFTNSMIEKYGGNIIFVPEFLREDFALNDAKKPTRIIFGINSINKSILRFQALLESQIQNEEKTIFMNTKEAEATKLFSNAYLAMRVAFFNELDSFGLTNDLDVGKIIYGLGRDPRIGNLYNSPSFMFSGYCLPKDSMELASEMGAIKNNQLIDSINKSNESRLSFIKDKIIQKALEISQKDINKITIGIYLLHTKRSGKDYRDSSSMQLFKLLKSLKLKVIVFDPVYLQSEKDFDKFINSSDLVVTNRYDSKLKNIKGKLFSCN